MAGWARDLAAGWDRQEILVTLLVVTSAWAASRIFLLFVDRVASRWTRRTAALQDDYVLAAIRRPVSLLIILVGVYAAIHRYAFRFRWFLDGLIFVAAVGLVIFTLIRVVAVLLAWYGERIRREPGTAQLSRDLLPLADKVARVILLVIGVFVILDHFDIEIRSILVTLGVGSLAIGLALQETLANMFGGFTLMLDRPFVVGDRIELAGGELGDVQAIGIRSTRVLTPEGNLLVIPNAHLVKTIVTNHSSPDTRIRVIVEVGIGYAADVERAKGLMLEAAAEQPLVLAEPRPAALFHAFGESSLLLRLVCHVRDFHLGAPARDALNSAIHAKFHAAGIEIPYPTRHLRVENVER